MEFIFNFFAIFFGVSVICLYYAGVAVVGWKIADYINGENHDNVVRGVIGMLAWMLFWYSIPVAALMTVSGSS